MIKLENIVFLSNTREKSGKRFPALAPEYGTKETVAQVISALSRIGESVLHIEADERAYRKLYELKSNNRIDLVFNMAEGIGRHSREAHFPALLELLDIPYTGGSPLTAISAFDKIKTKLHFIHAGVPTPNFEVIHGHTFKLAGKLKYPLFIKPVYGGSSIGIQPRNKVSTERELKIVVKKMLQEGHAPVLVEEFIDGREFSIGFLGEELLPFDEKVFKGKEDYQHHTLKMQGRSQSLLSYECPAKNVDIEIRAKIRKYARLAFRATNCRDFARADFRLDKKGIPYFLDINSPPCIVGGSFRVAAQAAGYDFNLMIKKIVESALKRFRTPVYP